MVDATSGGMSRRDLIKKSAVAGGLVWASPVLLQGVASAQTNCRSCPNGVLYTLKIPSGSAVNCGQGCLERFTCGTCLFDVGAVTFVATEFFTNGKTRAAEVTLDPRLRLVATSGKFSGPCSVAPVSSCDDDPPFSGGNPRITVFPGTPPNPGANPPNPGTPTTITFVSSAAPSATGGDVDPLNHVDITVCFSGGTKFPGC